MDENPLIMICSAAATSLRQRGSLEGSLLCLVSGRAQDATAEDAGQRSSFAFGVGGVPRVISLTNPTFQPPVNHRNLNGAAAAASVVSVDHDTLLADLRSLRLPESMLREVRSKLPPKEPPRKNKEGLIFGDKKDSMRKAQQQVGGEMSQQRGIPGGAGTSY